MELSELQARLDNIRASIARAAHRAGRSPDSITLLAVSKTQPVQAIRMAMEAGQLHFGENYAQQLRDKCLHLNGAQWHFIGHLQRNKIKYVAPHACMFHGLDSIELAKDLSIWTTSRGLSPLTSLIQVKLDSYSGEKTGVEPEQVTLLLEECARLAGIRVVGLMGVPPYSQNPEEVRPSFRKLAQMARELGKSTGIPLDELSMGMSGDYETAIEEGATIVRVGTAIFGERA